MENEAGSKRHRGRRRTTTLVVIGALGAAAGVAVALQAQTDGGSVPVFPTDGAPAVSGIGAGAQTRDAKVLAARFTENPFTESVGMDVGSIRRSLETERLSVFTADTDKGWVCVIMVSVGAGGVPVSSCLPRSLMRERPVVVEAVRANGNSDIAGIVPDGYTQVVAGARAHRVVANTFAIEDVPGTGTLTVPGSEGRPSLSSNYGGRP